MQKETMSRQVSAEWRDGWREGFEAFRLRAIAEAMIKNDFDQAQKWLGYPMPEPPTDHPVETQKL